MNARGLRAPKGRILFRAILDNLLEAKPDTIIDWKAVWKKYENKSTEPTDDTTNHIFEIDTTRPKTR